MLLRSGRLLNRVQEQMIFACVRSDVPIEDRGTVKDTSGPEFWIEDDEADREPNGVDISDSGFETPRRSLPPSSNDHHQKMSESQTWPPCGLPAWSRDSIDQRSTETSSAVAKIASRFLVWF